MRPCRVVPSKRWILHLTRKLSINPVGLLIKKSVIRLLMERCLVFWPSTSSIPTTRLAFRVLFRWKGTALLRPSIASKFTRLASTAPARTRCLLPFPKLRLSVFHLFGSALKEPALSGQTVHLCPASKKSSFRKPLGNCKFTTELQNFR